MERAYAERLLDHTTYSITIPMLLEDSLYGIAFYVRRNKHCTTTYCYCIYNLLILKYITISKDSLNVLKT